jgi:hypothetical protein
MDALPCTLIRVDRTSRRARARFLILWLTCLLTANADAQQVWPDGWLILPPVAGNEVFAVSDDAAVDGTVLKIATEKDAGSLLIDVDVPVTDATTLQWRWQVHDLPSLVAEDTESTHDYLAIAVMFDTEQVLSYMWSAELPTGTVFACPLPRWKDRETHIVLYSGDAQLGNG